MKIVKQNESPILKKFSEIKYGEVFFYDGEYVLKISDILSIHEDCVNAVFLNDGETGTFNDYEEVLPIDCELVIK